MPLYTYLLQTYAQIAKLGVSQDRVPPKRKDGLSWLAGLLPMKLQCFFRQNPLWLVVLTILKNMKVNGKD